MKLSNKWKKVIENPLDFTQEEKDKVLEGFMKEFFHFPSLCKVGFFTKEMKGDYKAQAKRVCDRFGFKTVYEYGLTAKHEPIGDGFWNEMKSIY
jgi:hypothetical protein